MKRFNEIVNEDVSTQKKIDEFPDDVVKVLKKIGIYKDATNVSSTGTTISASAPMALLNKKDLKELSKYPKFSGISTWVDGNSAMLQLIFKK